ncbi:PqiC family protein [Rheinheimera maricola]|uniref:ABC-type transport auxiliary lipoprotein family protein n=1 Tax=Rheinheimera maricola TaxID=2793282 RepID=A0ABS7X3F8_9GAMM|nr:ABC-type transport auxiliary lipoprotein family protein [Rheinheimera maricola]MBZ9610096.1 ABC-type transport auxiliary lipoprotein family protein [Rheinheimera maricola]
MKYLSMAVLLLLAACSSQPPVSFYQLPPVQSVMTAPSAAAKGLFVEPVQVAPYLNGRGLVLQVSSVELVMARQHLWAEGLDQHLQRQLRKYIPLYTPAYFAQLQPSADSVRLTVQLDRFHGLVEGYAVLSGRFSLSSQAIVHSFDLRLPLLNDGYPAMVTALGQGWEQLAQQIAQQLGNSA